MKKIFIFSLFFFFLILGAHTVYICVDDALNQEPGNYVAIKGYLYRIDYSGKYIWIKDKTGIIKIDIFSNNINYSGYDKPGVEMKAWGFIVKDKNEKIIRARKLQIGGYFYYSN